MEFMGLWLDGVGRALAVVLCIAAGGRRERVACVDAHGQALST